MDGDGDWFDWLGLWIIIVPRVLVGAGVSLVHRLGTDCATCSCQSSSFVVLRGFASFTGLACKFDLAVNAARKWRECMACSYSTELRMNARQFVFLG